MMERKKNDDFKEKGKRKEKERKPNKSWLKKRKSKDGKIEKRMKMKKD